MTQGAADDCPCPQQIKGMGEWGAVSIVPWARPEQLLTSDLRGGLVRDMQQLGSRCREPALHCDFGSALALSEPCLRVLWV